METPLITADNFHSLYLNSGGLAGMGQAQYGELGNLDAEEYYSELFRLENGL